LSPLNTLDCAHFAASRCRSCAWIERPYVEQLAAKQALAKTTLPESIEWLAPAASDASGFRNRAKMVVGGRAGAPVLGLIGPHNEPVDLTDCALYSASMQATLGALAAFIAQFALPPYDLTTKRGELKYLLLSEGTRGAQMLRFVARSRALEARMRKLLPELKSRVPALEVVSLNVQPQHQALLEGADEWLLTDQSTIDFQLNGLHFALGPQSFFQTHSALAAALYAQSAVWADALAPARVLDLYCGVGGFALHLAALGREVVGVERSTAAVASARYNAARNDRPVQFVSLNAETEPPIATLAPDLLIVNPPRRGLGGALCAAIEATPPPHLMYSSCAIETLAADLKRLPSFRPVRGRLFDLFPHTAHFETLLLLSRNR
jgi:23S rRNA (uracil747-C5)-methyltransferase